MRKQEGSPFKINPGVAGGEDEGLSESRIGESWEDFFIRMERELGEIDGLLEGLNVSDAEAVASLKERMNRVGQEKQERLDRWRDASFDRNRPEAERVSLPTDINNRLELITSRLAEARQRVGS